MLKTSFTAGIVSILITVTFGAVIFTLIFRPVVLDPSVKDLLFLLAGALGSNLTTVVSYYLGSSSSSKHKDETISSIATGSGSPSGVTAISPQVMNVDNTGNTGNGGT